MEYNCFTTVGYFLLYNKVNQLLIYVHCWCLVTQLCLTLCNPMDCSLPGSSVLGISQVRIREWVALSSSRGSSRPRDWSLTCIASGFFTTEPPGKPRVKFYSPATTKKNPILLITPLLPKLHWGVIIFWILSTQFLWTSVSSSVTNSDTKDLPLPFGPESWADTLGPFQGSS